jgi:hypothetical protein
MDGALSWIYLSFEQLTVLLHCALASPAGKLDVTSLSLGQSGLRKVLFGVS